MENLYERAKDYGSKILACALLIGALNGCRNSDKDYVVKGTFKDFYAIVSLDENGRSINLFESDDIYNGPSIKGFDLNNDGNIERIEFRDFDVGTVKANELLKYANKDSLESVIHGIEIGNYSPKE